MLDAKFLRNNIEEVAQKVGRRGFVLDVAELADLEDQRKGIQVETQELQNKRKTISKEIGKVKGSGGDAQPLLDEVAQIALRLDESSQQLNDLQDKINDIQLGIPNILSDEVPDGNDEEDNVEVRSWGTPRQFDFDPKDHADLGVDSGMIDFESSAKITGSRFVVMKSGIAKLHRALTQFMLDTHVEDHGYEEIYVPYMVNADSLYGTGQLPKFEEDLFALSGDKKYYLIPTAEVPVTNMVRDEIISPKHLPIKYVCHTPCFRSEAGSAGKDVRGMIRQHQFEKVELVNVVHPDESDQALEDLTACAEKILQKLDLPYRTVILCAGDTGFSSSKTYDIEVWLPGANAYREISSCSNFQDFQARRLQARWRNPETGKPELVHTLNGSGLAVGRTLIAVMENYQQADGSIKVPEALKRYITEDVIKL
ncbi:MAG: serine--tRNA ligase [Gammaproteobacteria bacterium]|nr:MAG: serine--tRNA ligase [Gammaproteobacteria bacterium]